MGAQHTAIAVADKLIRKSIEDEVPITTMQVQKLTYFCHAWMLGTGNGPLFQDAVESWKYGPVIRNVYHSLKHNGRKYIRKPLLEEADEFSEMENGIINAVWKLYGSINGIRLSKMTHAKGTPWHQTYSQGTKTQIIHNHIIGRYYANITAQQGL